MISQHFYHNDLNTGVSWTHGGGKYLEILDACLINGYNLQTLTSLTLSGTTVTATKTAHGFRNRDVIEISGAIEVEYDGKFPIFNVTNDTFDYTITGTPTSPATGTITAKKASLGWTKEFIGSNQAVYRPPAGNRFYLQVLDNNTNYCDWRAYEEMTDLTSGNFPFPTPAQRSNGFRSFKQDSGYRWYLCGDDKAFYLFAECSATDRWNVIFFGDCESFYDPDPYCTVLCGGVINSTSGSSVQYDEFVYLNKHDSCRIARNHNGIDFNIYGAKFHPFRWGQPIMGGGWFPIPSPYTNTMFTAPIFLWQYSGTSVNAIRGRFPGLYAPLHSRPWSDDIIIPGRGPYEGREFKTQMVRYTSNQGQALLDLGDWRT